MESSRITNGGWLLVTNAHIVGTKTVDGKVDGRCRKGSENVAPRRRWRHLIFLTGGGAWC